MSDTVVSSTRCSIARTLEVLGEKWTLLIVREAFWGASRFSDFRTELSVSSDILTARLATLVEHGVMERRSYRDEGARERFSYHLTESGEDLRLLLGALTAWGDTYRPNEFGRTTHYRDAATGSPVRVAFVNEAGEVLDASRVEMTRGSGDRLPQGA